MVHKEFAVHGRTFCIPLASSKSLVPFVFAALRFRMWEHIPWKGITGKRQIRQRCLIIVIYNRPPWLSTSACYVINISHVAQYIHPPLAVQKMNFRATFQQAGSSLHWKSVPKNPLAFQVTEQKGNSQPPCETHHKWFSVNTKRLCCG